MVLIFNMLPFLAALLTVVVVFKVKTRKTRLLAVAWFVLFMLVYPKIQPSYLPKGDIKRTAVPGFEASKAEIEDRNRKPVPSEERNAEQERQYREGAPSLK